MPPKRRRVSAEPTVLPSKPAANEIRLPSFRVPIRGLGTVRVPSLSLSQLALVAGGAALGGLAVYAALEERPVAHDKPKRKKWLPRLLGTGPLATDALAYGRPGSLLDVLIREAYVTAYDRSKKHPAWTAEHLTKANLRPAPVQQSSTLPLSEQGKLAEPPKPEQNKEGEKVEETRSHPPPGVPDRAKSEFREDEEVPELFRSKLVDYVGSGYDRGHMVAAADARRNQAAMNETFMLTNIAPQVGEGFNRHYWAWLESFCRNLTNSFEDVYVFTVPLYLPKLDPLTKKWRVSYEVIGPPSLAPSISVPTHFAKVVLTRKETGDASLGAFVLPNAKIPDFTPLESFVVPVDSVERASGFVFFNETVKKNAIPLCQATKCDVVRRFFDDKGNATILEAPVAKSETTSNAKT